MMVVVSIRCFFSLSAAWARYLVPACVAWALAAGAVGAQEQPAAAAEPTRVAEVGPEIFYLQDEAGRLVPVPGFRYRDFVELFRMQEGLPGAVRPPAAVLETLAVRIDLEKIEAASCPVVVEFSVRQTRAGWVNVPVDLEGLLLGGPARHEGAGRMLLDTVPERGGYRVWFDAPLEGGSDETHQVVLEGRLAVEVDERSVGVGLRLPTANTTLVELRSPRSDPEVAVQPQPPRGVVVSPAERGSVASFSGLSGPVRIRVAERGSGSVAGNAVPQAAVESIVRIDGRNAFIEASLSLENLRPGTVQLRVALPPRTTLRSLRGGTLVGRSGGGVRPVVDIAIEADPARRATLELDCERPIDPAAGSGFEAIGFAVSDIADWRQWGRVSLVVEGDWRAEWGDAPALRRVDPPPAARRPGFVAAFAYDALPASLPVQVQPRRSRVVIEPEYRYEIAATRVSLLARLRIAARGAPVAGIELAIDPAWGVDDVGPPGLVDTTAVMVDEGTVTVPFLQSLAGDAVLEVRASRGIERSEGRLSWDLPRPKADLVGPATVIIAAESDIEVLPDPLTANGMTRQAVAGQPRGDAERTALVYRLDAREGRFSGTRRFLPRRVDAVVTAAVEIGVAEMSVAETIRLDVVHVPLEYVELSVPDAVAAAGTLELRQGDLRLEPLDVREPGERPAADGARPVRAILAMPLLGSGELSVRYRLPTPGVAPQTTVAADLPLVLPLGARIDRQAVAIEASETLAVDVRGEAWRRDSGVDEPRRSWVAGRREEMVPLALVSRPRVNNGGTIVEATWLSTRLLPQRREDLHACVLAGSGERVALELPCPEGDGVECVVTLDGAPLSANSRRDGFLVFDLPRLGQGRRRLLEMRISQPRDDGWGGVALRLGMPDRIALTPPAFTGDVTQRRFYWDVAVRPDEHLLAAPRRWTAQQDWRQSAWGLRREPIVSPANLAAWIARGLDPEVSGGRPSALAEPPLASGRAVYSGVGPPGRATLWLVPTWFLVLAASGAALAAGLALAYVPLLRRPLFVVPLAAAAGLTATAVPDAGTLVAQAAVPGAVLAILAWLLRAWLDRDPSAAVSLALGPSGSSLTREAAPPPSVLVTPSAAREAGIAAVSRSAS